MRVLSAGVMAVGQSAKKEPVTFLGTTAKAGGYSSILTGLASGLFFIVQSIYL